MLVTHNIQNKFGNELTRHAVSTVHAGGVKTLLIGLQHITGFCSKPMDFLASFGSNKNAITQLFLKIFEKFQKYDVIPDLSFIML